MKRFLVILLLLLAIGAIWYYLAHRNEAQKRHALTLYGNVDVRQVDLGFRVSGRVVAMPFDEGDLIQEGTLMARLDRQPYQDEVLQARASLEAARVSYANADKLLERRRGLTGNGSVSIEDYDNTQATRDTAWATLKQNRAALGTAMTNLRDTEMFAPTLGTILTRIREPGSVVTVGEPVYTLSVLNPVWVRAYVSERDLGLIYPDMPAEIHTDTPGGIVYHGHVGFISPVAEFTPKTVETTQLRTDLVYRLRIIADNPNKVLKQGMPVTVVLPLEQTTNEESRG